MDDSIDSGNFSGRGYLPLIRKDSITCMHGLAVYVKEELLFPQGLSPENSADCYLCFRLPLLHSLSYSFSSIMDSFLFYYNIDEVLLINPSADVFVFGDSNIHHKD